MSDNWILPITREYSDVFTNPGGLLSSCTRVTGKPDRTAKTPRYPASFRFADLPKQLDCELNEPRRTSRRNATEVRARPGIPVGLHELRVIPRIKQLGTKLQSCCVVPERERLLKTQVPVSDSRAVENRWTAVPEIAHARRRKAGGVKPKQPVVAYVVRQMVVAPVADTVRQRGDKWASSLVGPSEIDRLPGREDGDRCDRPPMKRYVCPAVATPEGDLPYCARNDPVACVERGRTLRATPAVRDLVGTEIGSLPAIGERLTKRVLEPQIQPSIHPVLVFSDEGLVG
jgi:hypothetical protein